MKYQVKKSVWAAVTPLCVLFFWLIIPLCVMIFRMIRNSCFSIEFYDDRVVQKSGVFNKSEKSNVFTGVLAVSVNQSLIGRILGYGDIRVDMPGKWDIDTTAVKDPQGLKKYLEAHVVSANNLTFVGQQ